jgi:hypothetical protein
MSGCKALLFGCVLAALAAVPVHATTIVYAIDMDGAQEAPLAGDPDGSAVGTLTIDDATGAVSWSLTYSNIAAPTGMHIHLAPPGVAGAIVVDLGVATTGGPGTLINSTTTLPATALLINTTPGAYYINVHNLVFSQGAVRDQLGTLVPEPALLSLLAAGGVAVLAGRRRT